MTSPAAGPAAAAATAAAIATAVQKVKEVFATSFIGFAVATTAYGISVLQCYLYYRNYRKDAFFLKLTVGSLLIFDTLSTIMVSHSLYTYFVINFGNLAADGLIPWSFALENGLLTVVTIIAQCFYVWQIWTVSFNIIVTVGILLLGLASFGLGLWITVHLFRFPEVASVAGKSFQAVSDPVQGTAAACDIAITAALIWYLRSKKSRSGVRTTQNMIDTLIAYAVCRGILTALTQIVFLILNAGWPDRTYWQPFHQLVGKLYVNSVVASLNVRKVVSGRDESTISVSTPYQFSTGGEESTTRSLPLAFIRSKTGRESRSQGDTIGSLDRQEQYRFSDPHANDTKTGMIPDAV